MKNILVILSIITITIAADTKISGTTYFDYTIGGTQSGFNFNRQYIAFSGKASDDLQYKIIFDVGRVAGDPLTVFLKKAQINYNASFAKVSMGLIGMNTYGVQEKNWGYRFIEKSAMDLYGYSSTADLGIGFSKFINTDLNVSVQFVNGEGYKKPQQDKHHKISINATYGEGDLNNNEGYNIGLVYSTETTETDPITVISAFGGFAKYELRVGGEYNIINKEGLGAGIISMNVNYRLKRKMDVFFRSDFIPGDEDILGERIDNYYIAGVVLDCGSGLSIAPNLTITKYDYDKDAITKYRVNVQYKF